MTAPKKPTKKRVRKSRAKAPTPPKDTAPVEAAAVATTAPAPDPEPATPWAENPIFEQSAKVARNADAHTMFTKRQKAIVDVVLSMAGVNLQDMADDGGELKQVGVVWDHGDVGVRVPYNEIVQAFVEQAPYLAESIRVTDER